MIGEWMKAQRKGRGWTQADLAVHSGIKVGYIRQLEINTRSQLGPKILSQLAGAFGVTIDQIIREAGLIELPEPLEHLRGEGVPDVAIAEIAAAWPVLSPEDQETALAVVRSLAERRQAKDEMEAQKQKLQPRPASN